MLGDNEGSSDETREQFEHIGRRDRTVGADGFGGVEAEARREHSEPVEHGSVVGGEGVIGAVDGGAQGAVTVGCVAPAGDQDPETIVEESGEIGDAHRLESPGRELESEGDPVEAPADLHHRCGIVGVDPEPGMGRRGALGEQAHRVSIGERLQIDDVLAVDGQRFATRSQQSDARSALEDRGGQRGDRAGHVLAVVDHQHQVLPGQETEDPVVYGHAAIRRGSQRRRHGDGDAVDGIGGNRREVAPPNAVP